MKGIIDTTLREGAQTAGVHFSFEQKLAIVKALSRVGVEEIELGIATRYDSELADLVKESREIANGTLLSLWCRCVNGDIAYAAELKPDVLSLSIPVSDLHIEKKLRKSRAGVVEMVRVSLIEAGQAGFKKVSLGLEDATRADRDFVQKIISVAINHGVKRVRIADTVGIMTPEDCMDLVGDVACSGVELGVHCHNDFGMATANALSALGAGADWADVTVLGLGERTGNARLEEVVGYLALKKGMPYRTGMLKSLCALVSEAARKPIDRQHPVVGENIFACETGLHLHGLKRDPRTYEPYDPKLVGAERRLMYGSKIGKSAFVDMMRRKEINMDPECINESVVAFRQSSASHV